ncbi:hypothetical protein FIBSPDRAFT_281486 [Athelia psychrophila]|uniref:Uncharacterized protein n=1 Tax=Athelia psychrophila TaxID=1759441 RepID=A0A167XSY0_9AGAM|nr:hypothetical protein FIBSPDRAFT_281486 [Fibularhizoctonia sp. CBS 109695]
MAFQFLLVTARGWHEDRRLSTCSVRFNDIDFIPPIILAPKLLQGPSGITSESIYRLQVQVQDN